MSLLKINRHPSPKDLRVFATLWFLFLGGGGLLAQQRGLDPLAWCLWSLAAVGGGLGALAPRSLRLLYLGLVYLTFPIGFVVSHLVLGGVYYLLLTPIGLVMRALGRDPLQRRFEKNRPTYWIRRTERRPPASYLRQH